MECLFTNAALRLFSVSYKPVQQFLIDRPTACTSPLHLNNITPLWL